jgi:hypothetical protein
MDIHDLDDLRYPYDLGNHHMCHGQKRDCQKQFKGSLVFFTDDYKPKKIMFWVDPQLDEWVERGPVYAYMAYKSDTKWYAHIQVLWLRLLDYFILGCNSRHVRSQVGLNLGWV